MQYKELEILVVDDSMVMRRVVSKRLHEMGFLNILEAGSGQDALAILENQEVKLVLSDWCMPGLTGIDLLKMVRCHEVYAQLPFVLLTAEAQLYTIIAAYRAGVSQYVTKPFTKEYFHYIVNKVIREYYGD